MQGNKKTPGSLSNSAITGLTGMGQTIASSPYLESINNLVSALQDPTAKATSFLKSEAKSLIPSGISTIATATDPLQRNATTPLQAVQSAIPGAREGLTPKVNVLGQSVQRNQGVIGSLLDPLYSSNNLSGPVVDELKRLDQSQNNATATQVTSKNAITGQTLTPQQLEQFQQTSGQSANTMIQNLMKTPEYQQASDADKATAVGNLFTAAKSQTRTGTQSGTTTSSSVQLQTQTKAQQKLDKAAFDNSDSDFQIKNGLVYTRNADGTPASPIKENTYNMDMADANMTSAKDNGDINGWLQNAVTKYQALTADINDPTTSSLTKEKDQNTLYTLVTDANKYIGYGGFTKPKSSSSKKVTAASLSTPNTITKDAAKVTVKKPSVKGSKTGVKLASGMTKGGTSGGTWKGSRLRVAKGKQYAS
jgi:hypothetical protein